MRTINATLAACIVLAILGITLVNPNTSFVLDLIVATALFAGVIRPAWITWFNWLNKTN
jgi:hypothetical protein